MLQVENGGMTSSKWLWMVIELPPAVSMSKASVHEATPGDVFFIRELLSFVIDHGDITLK